VRTVGYVLSRSMRLVVVASVALLLIGGSGCDSLKARMLAQDAVQLYRRGAIREAAAKFENAEHLDPYIATIQLDLGFANLALYQGAPHTPDGEAAAAKAITAFERYLALRPGEERARSYLTQTFVDTGHYDAAVTYFKPMVERPRPDPEALSTLGIIASKTGRYAEAKRWYEQRITAEPRNADARLALGVLMWDQLHSHAEITGAARISVADEALTHLRQSIDLKPKAPNAYTYANLVYRERAAGEPNDDGKRADLEQAQKLFKQAADLQKGH
jgi:tetratricopeptide (TPR) repeat protein